MKTRIFYVFQQKKRKNILKKLVVIQEGFTFALSKIKIKQPKPYGSTVKPNLMTTKGNVLEMIEAMHGNDTCVFTADAQGYNGEYHRIYVDDLLDDVELGDESWELAGFSKLNEGDIDVDEFCQDFTDELIDGVKEGIKKGEYYLATFTREECGYGEVGTYQVLVWE